VIASRSMSAMVCSFAASVELSRRLVGLHRHACWIYHHCCCPQDVRQEEDHNYGHTTLNVGRGSLIKSAKPTGKKGTVLSCFLFVTSSHVI
jgi:hypothetical protein